ncbi:MAG: energy transducer TonB [Candidatus Acidiferrales bacterium]
MSDLGSLSECLVDNDPAARVRARRLRSKALVLSVALETLILAALLLWPLVAPGVLTAHYIVTPAPPYSGGGAAHHQRSATRPSRGITFRLICLAVCAPVVRPSAPENSSEAPDIGPDQGGGSEGAGLPGSGPSFPGGTGDRVIVPEPPHAEPPHVRTIQVSGGVMAAMLVNRVEPQYPAIAKAAHISGTVHLRAIIGKDGTVRQLEVMDGNPLLARAALLAVQAWRYRPTRLNGEPVEVETYVTVNFVLN